MPYPWASIGIVSKFVARNFVVKPIAFGCHCEAFSPKQSHWEIGVQFPNLFYRLTDIMSRILWCITLSLLITACTTSSPTKLPDVNQQEIRNFQLVGRLAIRYGEENTHAKIRWQHRTDADDVLLMSPLGQTVAEIVRTKEGVRLTQSDKKPYYAEDVETLTEKTLGWQLPLKGLSDWVLGRKTSGESTGVQTNKVNQIEQFRQDGWLIEYLRFQLPDQPSVPTRINLSRNNPNLEIRLVIDEWIWD